MQRFSNPSSRGSTPLVTSMGRYTVSGSGTDCKSVAFGSGGSTPSLPTSRVLARERVSRVVYGDYGASLIGESWRHL